MSQSRQTSPGQSILPQRARRPNATWDYSIAVSTFHHHTFINRYQSAILPKLEYCSSVWDPHHQSEIDALEGVHKFASKVVTRTTDSISLRKSLNWPTLSQIQKLKICYNILNLSIIPPSFIPHSHPSPRHPHTNSFRLICQHLCP